MSDDSDIKDRIVSAMVVEDVPGIVRGLQDLQDVGWTELKIHSRHITKDGLRFVLETDVQTGKQKFLNLSRKLNGAQKLILRLRVCKDVLRVDAGQESQLLQHKNEMSPEDYEWVCGG